MDSGVPAHWLRPNESSATPHRVMFIDTETRPDLRPGAELHRLRWWQARLCRRHVARPRGPVKVDSAGETAGQLADVVDQAAIAKHTLWIYIHNLGFDLTVTGLPEQLFNRGWMITDLSVTGKSVWIRMNHGRRRIVLADSHSWLPAPLADVGELVGVAKPPVEDWSAATDEDIAVRCLADVVILSEAMLTLMNWWDDNDMGRWSWTGPGCGWASFRHKHLHSKVLMDPNEHRLALERRAIYGGRREAYKIGRLGDGHYADLDFEAAYPRLASRTPLPRRAIAHVPGITLERYRQLPDDWGVLAECEVTTRAPVVPCRVSGSVLYPVGTFATVLAGPDIDGAIARGAVVTIGKAVIYQLEPFLAEWGAWVCGVTDGTGQQVPPVVRMWAKHMGRTVIGRFALRAQRTEDWGDACWPHFKAEPGTDMDTGCEVVDLHACGRHLRLYRDQEPENVFPAVTAWIEAACRQLLADAMDACQPGTVLQCDTDGFMIGVEHGRKRRPGFPATGAHSRCADDGAANPLPPVPERAGPLTVRVKGLYRDASILGPQQLLLGGTRKLSGVPRAFTSCDGLTYHGWAWPGYTWQLAHSQPGVYTRPEVTIALRGPYGGRWLLRDGRTLPPEARLEQGQTVIVAPWSTSSRYRGRALADGQPPALEAIAGRRDRAA